MKYRKKPVVIEAVQVLGTNDAEVKTFCPIARDPPATDCRLIIRTLEGDMTALRGDWIIKGVIKGEFYPVKDDIFRATYEPVGCGIGAAQMVDDEVLIGELYRRGEREMCKQDVCMYCGGRALGYTRVPTGPNEAGNWTHLCTKTLCKNDRVLCLASSIFARESFFYNLKKKATTP